MTRTLRVAAAALLAMATAAPTLGAQRAASPEVLIETGRQMETLHGDLAGAAKQYEMVADTYASTNPAAAARALLALADVYRRMGGARAAAAADTYRRIVREHPAQTEAVSIARARLGQSPASQGGRPVERTLWSGADLPEGDIVAVSPDSRSVAYVRLTEDGDGALVLRDVAAGTDRPVTTSPGPSTREHAEYAVSAAFSRDGSRLAYNWRVQALEPGANSVKIVDELRVIDLTQPGIPRPRMLFRDENTQGYGVAPKDWTPDGERIVVAVGHGDERTRQIGFISVRDGKLTVLRTLDWRNATRVSLSPDGRFLAYDLPADEQTGQRDIFVLATDGSRQVTAVGGPGRDVVVGWSPDGSRLLFTRDNLQLWAQPIADGRPQGAPSIVRADARDATFFVTAAGDLFSVAAVDERAFYRVPVDFATGRSLGSATVVPGVWPGSALVDWSPDGRSFASIYTVAGDLVLSVRSLDTGGSHVLSLPLSFFDNNNFGWLPDGRALIVRGADMNGRLGVYRVNVADGRATPVLLPPPDVNITRPSLSRDGAKLHYIRAGGRPVGEGGLPNGRGRFFVERDLASGREREIVQLDRPNAAYGGVSPDGKYIGAGNWTRKAANGLPTPDAAWTFSVISTADGAEREIFRAEPPAQFLGGPAVEWTPDGRFAVVRKVVGEAHELWAVPIAGGQAHRLDLGPLNYTGKQVRISPDGREIVVQAGNPIRQEVRVMERFLAAATR
jgi:Tol biopolymer transport system component